MNPQELNAETTEVIKHRRQLSPEEKEQLRKDHTDEMIELDGHLEEIKAVKDEKAPRLKELRGSTKKLRSDIRKGYVEEDRECYLVPDHTAGMMQYIDTETNEVLMERKLMPHEKQLRIPSELKKNA